jgi:hypothetical protein
MANEFINARDTHSIGPMETGTQISWGETRGKKWGMTMRTYDRLMTELQTMRSARSGGNRNVEQLIDIYNRIANKGDSENSRVHPFPDNCLTIE